MIYKFGRKLLRAGFYTSIFFFGVKCGRGCDNGLERAVDQGTKEMKISVKEDISDPLLDYLIERTSGKRYSELYGGK